MMLPSKSRRRDPSLPSLPSHRLEFQRVKRDRRSSVSRHRLPFMRHGGIFRDASAVAVTEGVTRNSFRPSLWNGRKIPQYFEHGGRCDGSDGYRCLLLEREQALTKRRITAGPLMTVR